MNKEQTMSKNEERPASNLLWGVFFDYQRQTSRLLRTMMPEPFSSSLEAIEENIIVPIQENTERLSVAMLENSKMFMPWFKTYTKEDTEYKQKQDKAA